MSFFISEVSVIHFFLAVPAKILEINGEKVLADFGGKVTVSLLGNIKIVD